MCVRLGQPVGKDGTLRDLLLDQERLDGKTRDELDEARIPPWASELWAFFLALHRTRRASFAGVSPIHPADVAALAQLYQVRLSPWEIDTLLEMDAAVCAAIAEIATKRTD